MIEDSMSINSDSSNDSNDNFNEVYDDMKDIFEEYKILSKSQKLSNQFSFSELIDYKDTEKYNEICPYHIPFLHMLSPIEDLDMNDMNKKECYIIPYTLSINAILPFLLFYLSKNTNNELSFLNYDCIFENIYTLLQYSFSLLKKDNFILKGYQLQNNKYYFFVEINCFQPSLLNTYSTIVPLVLDELVYKQQYLQNNININICNYFIFNIDNFILTRNDKSIEIPIVVYSTHNIKKSEFYSIFGIPKSKEIINNQYTFFSLEELLEKNDIKENGLNRNIIFCGKQHHIKMEDYNEEVLLNCDSLYIYNHTLYKYIWIAKEYQQQLPISYHLVKDVLR